MGSETDYTRMYVAAKYLHNLCNISGSNVQFFSAFSSQSLIFILILPQFHNHLFFFLNSGLSKFDVRSANPRKVVSH